MDILSWKHKEVRLKIMWRKYTNAFFLIKWSANINLTIIRKSWTWPSILKRLFNLIRFLKYEIKVFLKQRKRGAYIKSLRAVLLALHILPIPGGHFFSFFPFISGLILSSPLSNFLFLSFFLFFTLFGFVCECLTIIFISKVSSGCYVFGWIFSKQRRLPLRV